MKIISATAAPIQATRKAEILLDALAESLQIPDSKYEAAERSYQSLGRWLDRPESRFAGASVSVYSQGSFRLGTAIRPHEADGQYDLDVVCELDISKTTLSQEQLKQLLGAEIKAYAVAKGMAEPTEARRCWTLNYADGAQFHMDILPALPDGTRQRMLVEAAGLNAKSLELALAITCIYDLNYKKISPEWPGSNPKGYADWFRERMKLVFRARRESMRLEEALASIEAIPEYRVKTPMQSAIQIIKRHRDVRFSGEYDVRPISIVLTTLAALAYNQETTISGALFGILSRMDEHIEERGGVSWIENPADPRENFADKWKETPEKKDAFYDWLQTARDDFALAARAISEEEFVEALAPRMGRSIVESAVKSRLPPGQSWISSAKAALSSKLLGLRDAPHRKAMTWPALASGTVSLSSVTVNARGFRPVLVGTNGGKIARGSSLTFNARSNIAEPFKVFWQVVNTGEEARIAKKLRGGFEEGPAQSGGLTRRETASYSGSHSIECFIVKDGYCVARSGTFIINIA